MYRVLKLNEHDDTLKESNTEFTMYNENTGKSVNVWKDYESGKWVDSDGNQYMGYLSKADVKSYFRGNWIEESAKVTKITKLIEAEIDDELQDKLDTNEEESQEDIEDIEDAQDEIVDSEEDQDENPIEEESELDQKLNEIRDILVDLDDIRLYKIVGDDEEFYILGKVSDESNNVEMLVDTQPVDLYAIKDDSESNEDIPTEEVEAKFQFEPLPDKIDMIKTMYPKYGEDLNPRHEELISYLMNLLIEQNPEAAEELNNDEEVEISEPISDEEDYIPNDEEVINPEDIGDEYINDEEDENE